MRQSAIAPWKPIALLAMLLAIATLVFVFSSSSTAFDVSADPQNREIIAAVQRYYDAIHEAHVNWDVSVLAKAIANDPLYEQEIGRERAEEIREYITRVSGPERAKDFGYLTAMQNNLSHRFHGEQLLAGEMAKAEAEGRTWTNADTEALADRNYGSPPGLRELYGEGYVVEPEAFRTIEIHGDYAHAAYESVVLWKAIFKHINDQWVVIGIYR